MGEASRGLADIKGDRTMTLKCGRASERDVDNLGPGLAPSGVPQRVWATSREHGFREGKGLAWHRGNMAGQIDAILTLQKMGHVRIAQKLQEHYGFTDDGTIILAGTK